MHKQRRYHRSGRGKTCAFSQCFPSLSRFLRISQPSLSGFLRVSFRLCPAHLAGVKQLALSDFGSRRKPQATQSSMVTTCHHDTTMLTMRSHLHTIITGFFLWAYPLSHHPLSQDFPLETSDKGVPPCMELPIYHHHITRFPGPSRCRAASVALTFSTPRVLSSWEPFCTCSASSHSSHRSPNVGKMPQVGTKWRPYNCYNMSQLSKSLHIPALN